MRLAFDHLVIGAASLEQGDAWAVETLGAPLGPGGAHPLMGTHNRLARLATGYLEVIAIDPSAPPPSRRRWYGLDEASVRAAIAERPRPIAWVLNTDDLSAAAQRVAWRTSPLLDVSRGALSWRMALPEAEPSGDDPWPAGHIPALIEWPKSLNHLPPSHQMTPAGRALRRLSLLADAPEALRAQLQSVGVEAAMRAAGIELSVRASGPGDPADPGAPWPLSAMFTAPNLNVSA